MIRRRPHTVPQSAERACAVWLQTDRRTDHSVQSDNKKLDMHLSDRLASLCSSGDLPPVISFPLAVREATAVTALPSTTYNSQDIITSNLTLFYYILQNMLKM